MESITTIEDREAFNALYTAYYAARDAINERITQAYIESQGGDIFKDAIPSLVISNTVVKVHSSDDEWSDYEPSFISFYGHVSNGEYSAPYMGIFEVYRNGSETPFYKSIVPELSASFTIEDGTTSIRIVMRNSLGQIIYDREDIDFITKDSGVTLHLSNKYQSFYSGSLSTARAGEGVFFETEISAYNGLEQRPVHIGEIEAQQGFTFRTEGNKILFFPTGEIGESGTIGISATVEVTDGKVVGVKNGATPLVVGTKGTAIVAGKYESDYVTEFFNYINIDDEESRYTIVSNSGRYYGPYSSIDDVPGTVRKGDYILYTGESGEKYKKGLTYVFDGVNFTLDDSKEHQMASITDMLEMIDANTDGDAVALLLVDRLVTNTAFINRLISNNIFTKSLQITDGGSISGGYVPDHSGFLLNSNGYFECNNGKFVGDIDAGMIQISHMSPGVISIDYGGIDVFTFCENLAARDFEPQITYYGQGTYNGEYVNQFWYDYSTSATKTTTVEAWKNGGTESVWGWPSGSIIPKKASVRIIDYYKYTVKTTEKRVKIVFGDNIVVDKTYRMVTVTTAEKYSARAASTVNGFESNYPYIYSTTDKKVYQVAGNSNMGFTRVKAVNMTTPKAESYNPDSIGELSFRLNVDSPTFKMTNIPYYSENLEDWSVYRTTDGAIKIKLPQ